MNDLCIRSIGDPSLLVIGDLEEGSMRQCAGEGKFIAGIGRIRRNATGGRGAGWLDPVHVG
ncbi:MAG TPA: hypothetical protein VNZ57_15550 [Longimicrobiales bacterium]|nr:hypothetical protein [Longimicrobiales bacterium]